MYLDGQYNAQFGLGTGPGGIQWLITHSSTWLSGALCGELKRACCSPSRQWCQTPRPSSSILRANTPSPPCPRSWWTSRPRRTAGWSPLPQGWVRETPVPCINEENCSYRRLSWHSWLYILLQLGLLCLLPPCTKLTPGGVFKLISLMDECPFWFISLPCLHKTWIQEDYWTESL